MAFPATDFSHGVCNPKFAGLTHDIQSTIAQAADSAWYVAILAGRVHRQAGMLGTGLHQQPACLAVKASSGKEVCISVPLQFLLVLRSKPACAVSSAIDTCHVLLAYSQQQ